MSNPYLRNITNHFLDVRLLSLSSWRNANEITPRDRGGPYIVLQEGYDPQDTTMVARDFILGRSGKWLALEYFYRLPVPERREEFVFGRVGEVMEMMSRLPSKVTVLGKPENISSPTVNGAEDDMAAAIQAAKQTGTNAAASA